MIQRLILVLSLVGMILTTHLWIQKSRGFDQGCLGLGKPQFEQVQLPCTSETMQAAEQLFGVSNVAWGYAFYFGLALLAFAKMVAPGGWPRRLHVLSELSVAGGLLYSAYLVGYQALVVRAFCPLCLGSAVLVTLLAALHIALRLKGGFRPLAEAARPLELTYAAASLFAAGGLLLAAVLFVDRLGTRPLGEGENGREMQALVGRSLAFYIDPQRLHDMRACRLDPSAPRIDPRAFVGPDTPFLGNPAGLPVIVFFDPNCPHCRAFYPELQQLIAQDKDRAKFYILPRILWDRSILQVEAIELAGRQGKYFDCWRLQFERQTPRKGMDLARIGQVFRDLGLDTAGLASRLEALRPAVLAERDKAKSAGVSGTPNIYVDGMRVAAFSADKDCIAKLIDRVSSHASARPAAPAPAASVETESE